MDAWDLYKTPKDRRDALALVAQLEQMAARGNGQALAVLGLLYDEGLADQRGRIVVRPNKRKARTYDERGVALGDPDAMASLANRLSGIGASRAALARAVQLYRRAYALGTAFAAYNLACTYQNRGRYRDAVRWFRRAAAAGEMDALLEIAQAELYALGTRRNVKAAFAKLRTLAQSGATYHPASWMQADAMLVMARALLDGWPVPRDFTAGMHWLRRAASLGHQPAVAELEFRGGSSAHIKVGARRS